MNNEEFKKDVEKYKDNKNNKNNKRKIGLAVTRISILIITNLVTFYLAKNLYFTFNTTEKNVGENLPGIAINTKPTREDVDMFEKLFLVKDKLYKYFDGEIDEEKLVEGAIKGMTDALEDPYTVYLNQKEFERLNTTTVGGYVGVGIHVGVLRDKETDKDEVVIISPIADTPAEKAGLLPGDVIVKVNSQVIGKDIDKAVGIMKGKKGEAVTLSIKRKDKEIFDVEVIRDEIVFVTVRGEMLDNDIAYISVSTFDEHTAADFEKKLSELQQQGAKGLVLDLRGNPGGLVSACVGVSSNFIQSGKQVVYTIDKYDNKKVYKSSGGNAIKLPIVVLTNGGTASASEIVSGALKDYEKATIVGEKTFGKGIVQSIMYRNMDGFGDGTALKVTVSSYYTPNGINIHKKGIEPDIEVKYPEELLEKEYNREEDPQFQKALEVINDKVKNQE